MSALAGLGSSIFATYLTSGYLQTTGPVPSGSAVTLSACCSSADVMAASSGALWMALNSGGGGYLFAVPVSGTSLSSPVQAVSSINLSGGVAVSKDAVGLALWAFTNSGYLQSYSISGTSLQPNIAATAVPSPGAIAIAP